MRTQSADAASAALARTTFTEMIVAVRHEDGHPRGREGRGSAAAVKMCRSIVVKGIEALLFECVMAATKFGADDLVFASLKETLAGDRLEEARRLHERARRRPRRAAGAEMEEVAETLQGDRHRSDQPAGSDGARGRTGVPT